ncbi:hypothetical protein [Cellulophaga sp. HaHa_2_1]|uniref:hypothetical protein n=1 Tax=Cellulophaga sp. HaHa_2_1 TaxID=2749994 RepID=UPI001C4F4F9C|nr:hypothetical protein [Cellulophaga sp. HaHa_2_1]QXP52879.1 hypothetical protein H0I24_02845 [Cellulophaga sp. HaHa_2_1]
MNIKILDKLYLRYGYTINNKLSSNFVRVYTLNKGVYFGADIIINKEGEECQSILRQLSDAGYACRLKVFQSIEEGEKFLFDSFFHSSQLIERLQNKYKAFAHAQTEILKVNYEYIPVSYLLENEEFKPDKNIVNSVISKLTDKGAQLIIIEAAAGYGKTCTSYEIINKISLDVKDLSPIFTELSRDRRAAIFKHILQDVIVNEFHSLLDEELVIHEIQNGKIPLIIDGFDELLSKEQDKGNSEFEQVETMLSTIGDLLVNNAKIIITGRKTAIFSGDSFMNWIDANPNEFAVNRYLLNPPRIEDWLDDYKLEKVKENEIPINQISNPVLLAFLRSLSKSAFDKTVNTPNQIVDRYFDTILDREQERQQLNIEANEQLNIFRRLADAMIEFDITADSKVWIKELLLDRNYELLEKIRKSYSISKRPSLDELTNTLSNHALLDRKGNKDNVGFINDFIFGTFIGQNIIKPAFDINNVRSKHMIELAITAFQFQIEVNKNKLYEKVTNLVFFQNQDKLLTEYVLRNTILQKFENATFNDFSISHVDFNIDEQFTRCVFANCTFENISFSNEAFVETSFVNCVFTQCSFTKVSVDTNIYLLNCNDYSCGFINSVGESRIVEDSEQNTTLSEFILRKLLNSANRPRHRRVSIILNETKVEERGQLSKLINKFKTENLIKVNGDYAFLTELGIQKVNNL